jgi:hypothetical protein
MSSREPRGEFRIDRKITSIFSIPSPYPLPRRGEGVVEKSFFDRSLRAGCKNLGLLQRSFI